LDLTDIDRALGTVWVRQGKGGKDRVVPLGGHAGHWLEYARHGHQLMRFKSSVHGTK